MFNKQHMPNDIPKLPSHIALRTDFLAPLLKAYRKANPRAPWGRLIERGLRRELAPYATKRTRHLLRGEEPVTDQAGKVVAA